MISIKELYNCYFPKGTCKFDPILLFIGHMLRIPGLDYVTRSEVSFPEKLYTIVNVINIFIIIFSCLYGMKIGHTTDLKLNSLTFILLVSMVSSFRLVHIIHN